MLFIIKNHTHFSFFIMAMPGCFWDLDETCLCHAYNWKLYNAVIAGRRRPPQECPIRNDLTFQTCMSACQSFTCEDVRNEPPSGAWPCIRMCISGWACPEGQVLLDGYSDLCVAREVCNQRNETSCNYNNEVVQVNKDLFEMGFSHWLHTHIYLLMFIFIHL